MSSSLSISECVSCLIEAGDSSCSKCVACFTLQAKMCFASCCDGKFFLCSVLEILHFASQTTCFACAAPSTSSCNCSSRSLQMTVLFIPFCPRGTGLLAARVSARPQGRWRGFLDKRKTLVGCVARAAETVSHLVRGSEVHLPAANTLLLGISCGTDII